jgi:hypothetical protein
MRCPNTVLQNLPMGFTTDKPTNQVVMAKGSTVTSEYEVPVGGTVSTLLPIFAVLSEPAPGRIFYVLVIYY